MNVFQKAGVWLMRLIGVIVTVIGAVGPIYAGIAKGLGQRIREYPADRWIGSVFWVIGGVVLILLAKVIGRFLGRGLE